MFGIFSHPRTTLSPVGNFGDGVGKMEDESHSVCFSIGKNRYLCRLYRFDKNGRQQFHRLCEREAIDKSEKILKIGSRVRSIADFYFCGILVDWVKICIFVHVLLLVCYSELFGYRGYKRI